MKGMMVVFAIGVLTGVAFMVYLELWPWMNIGS